MIQTMDFSLTMLQANAVYLKDLYSDEWIESPFRHSKNEVVSVRIGIRNVYDKCLTNL